MAGEIDLTVRTIAVRRNGTALIPINALVSRGLQEAGALAALGSDALVAGSEFFTAFKGGDVESWESSEGVFGTEFDAGMSPKKIGVTVKLAVAAIEHGIATFVDWVEFVAEQVGANNALKISEYLESAWRVLGQRSDFQHIDAAGKVADILKEIEDVTNHETDEKA
jgi:hypothetical protein